jgi:hypothetical protein
MSAPFVDFSELLTLYFVANPSEAVVAARFFQTRREYIPVGSVKGLKKPCRNHCRCTPPPPNIISLSILFPKKLPHSINTVVMLR